MSKYRNAALLCDRMTHKKIDKRPNCEKILNDKNLWALAHNEFDCEKELRNNFDNNLYTYSILKTKLRKF